MYVHTYILSDDEAHGIKLDLVFGVLETVMDGLKEFLRVRVRQMLLKRLLWQFKVGGDLVLVNLTEMLKALTRNNYECMHIIIPNDCAR